MQSIEAIGLSIEPEVHRFYVLNEAHFFPYVILCLCTCGSARAQYDMQEMTQNKNDLGLIRPGHIMRPLWCSEDYTYARLIISQKMFGDLQLQTLSSDLEKYDVAPMCHLTDEQAQRILRNMEQVMYIARHSEEELPKRYQMLLAQLSVGLNLLDFYRREQDRQWQQDRNKALFSRFNELIVQHHTESREVQFYAKKLNLHPFYFSKIIREVSDGHSPAELIEQYVITQAKRIIEAHPEQSLKQIAYQLGFNEPTSFYRYFKHATGMTARQYRTSLV